MFRTQFESMEFIDNFYSFSNAGNGEKVSYEGYYDEFGRIQLRPNGKIDLYGKIQSFKDSVDINVILSKYVNGDETVLQRVQGVYGDFTDMPSDLPTMLNSLNKAKSSFESLPIEVRERFNNNYAEFIKDFGSDDFFSRMGYTRDEVVSKADKKPVDAVKDTKVGDSVE